MPRKLLFPNKIKLIGQLISIMCISVRNIVKCTGGMDLLIYYGDYSHKFCEIKKRKTKNDLLKDEYQRLTIS